MAVVAPTDRPKSVSNRCVIEVFGGDFVLSRSFFGFFSVGVRAFGIGLGQISSFTLSLNILLFYSTYKKGIK